MKKIIFILLTFLFIKGVFAQPKELGAEKKVSSFLFDNVSRVGVADTTTFYAFAFKLKLKKLENSKIKVESIESNDSVAAIFYPNYKQLAAINYEEFLKDKKEAVLIIPVLIGVAGTKYGTTKKNNLEDADKYFALFFNRKVITDPSSKTSGNVKYIRPDSKNYIYLFPYMLTLDLKTYY